MKEVLKYVLERLLRRPRSHRPKPPKRQPPWTGRSTADILIPSGEVIGQRARGAGPGIRTVSKSEFQNLKSALLDSATEIEKSGTYNGRMFERADGVRFGIRKSMRFGETIDIFDSETIGLGRGFKVHQR
jgi:hypothetical protein